MTTPVTPTYLKAYLVWTLLFVTFLFLAPLLDATNPGGMQLGMTALAYLVPIFITGYGSISIFMLLQRVPKNRDYLLINGFVLASVFWLYGSFLLSKLDDVDTSMQVRHEGRDEIRTERDYYHYGHQLKAIRQMRNAYPDSIWVEYSRFGSVTKRQEGKHILDRTPDIHE